MRFFCVVTVAMLQGCIGYRVGAPRIQPLISGHWVGQCPTVHLTLPDIVWTSKPIGGHVAVTLKTESSERSARETVIEFQERFRSITRRTYQRSKKLRLRPEEEPADFEIGVEIQLDEFYYPNQDLWALVSIFLLPTKWDRRLTLHTRVFENGRIHAEYVASQDVRTVAQLLLIPAMPFMSPIGSLDQVIKHLNEDTISHLGHE